MQLITVKLSEKQFDALERMQQVSGESKSDLIRIGLDIVGDAYNVDFPQDVAKRGKYKRGGTLAPD